MTYASTRDINGRYLIKSEDMIRDSQTEAEYVYVHFTLPYKAPIVDGGLYIIGGLTNWEFNKENKFKFYYKMFAYEGLLYLKQVYYNYHFVLLRNGEDVGDDSFIEGKHYETENEYTIYVYYKEQGVYYDQLIGVKRLVTGQ